MLLGACASKPSRVATPATPSAPGSGGYYSDDGPGANPPANLDQIPDATPRWEPLHRFANRPYTVLGRDYVPATELRPYKERGVASWYGRKFHRQRTSIGETYDMYAMTAAHPTLPLPSYAKVTNLANGRSVTVRVNDRGPFLHGRIIDLSYAAAQKLGFVGQGSARVDVESSWPEGGGLMATRSPSTAAASGSSATGGIAAASSATSSAVSSPAASSATPSAVSSPAASSATSSAVSSLAASSATPSAVSSPAALVAAAPLPAVSPVGLPASRDLPLRLEGADVFLQLGAFSTLDNAQNFLSVMEFQQAGNSNSGSEISYAPRIRSRDNLFRVELGPYTSQDDAHRATLDLESRFGVVVPSVRQR